MRVVPHPLPPSSDDLHRIAAALPESPSHTRSPAPPCKRATETEMPGSSFTVQRKTS